MLFTFSLTFRSIKYLLEHKMNFQKYTYHPNPCETPWIKEKICYEGENNNFNL